MARSAFPLRLGDCRTRCGARWAFLWLRKPAKYQRAIELRDQRKSDAKNRPPPLDLRRDTGHVTERRLFLVPLLVVRHRNNERKGRGGFGAAGCQLIVIMVEIEIKPLLPARGYNLQFGIVHRQLAKTDGPAAKVYETRAAVGAARAPGNFLLRLHRARRLR